MRQKLLYAAWAVFVGLIVMGVHTFINRDELNRKGIPQTAQEWWNLAEKDSVNWDKLCPHFPRVDLPDGFPEGLEYRYAGEPVTGELSTDVEAGIVRINLDNNLSPPDLVKPMGWHDTSYLEFNYEEALFYFPGASLVSGEVTVWLAADIVSVDFVILLPTRTVVTGMAGVALFPVPCYWDPEVSGSLA